MPLGAGELRYGSQPLGQSAGIELWDGLIQGNWSLFPWGSEGGQVTVQGLPFVGKSELKTQQSLLVVLRDSEMPDVYSCGTPVCPACPPLLEKSL